MTWLDGFERLTFAHSLGGSFDRDPRAVCWHTTEGSTVQGAFSVYQSIQACPHFTVDPETCERYQHVPLDRSSYALRNLEGGCQTNTTGIIQIEIVGKAAETWSWSAERLRWLGEEVLAPIFEACLSIPRGPVYSGARWTCAEWEVWSGGQLGHAQVPENDHWDPGDLDLKRIVDYATGDIVTPEDIEAIAQRCADVILNERKIVILNDAGQPENHGLFNTVGFDYEQDRRATALLRELDAKFDALAKVAITTEEP